MSQTLMANIDKDLITVRMVSEANSDTYKLNIGAPSAGNPKLAYLKINDVDLQAQSAVNPARGLNIRSLNDPSGVNEIKQFDLATTDNSTADAFIQYMNDNTHKLVIIISGKDLKSSPKIDAWFASRGSVNWPGAARCNRFNFTYIALYSPSRKKIIMEAHHGEDNPVNEGFCTLETVFDSFDDLGATGFAKKVVYDPSEYVSTSGYEFKRYPENVGLIASLGEFGLAPGSTVMLSGEMFQSKELVDAGLTARINLRWYKGTSLADSLSVMIPSNVVDKWYKIQDTFSVVPPDTDGFTIVAARYPRNDSVVALASVKNLTVSEVSRTYQKTSHASIGVNGIKTNNLVEGTTSPLLLQLPDSGTFANNTVPLVGIKELELEY